MNWIKQLFSKKKPKQHVRRSLCGKEIPIWCVGDSVNTYKYEISKKQRKAIRMWYLKNTPDSVERIKEIKSNWIGTTFGTNYYSPDTKEWNGFRLCIGRNVYVRLC